jgi:hypothetical protein
MNIADPRNVNGKARRTADAVPRQTRLHNVVRDIDIALPEVAEDGARIGHQDSEKAAQSSDGTPAARWRIYRDKSGVSGLWGNCLE